MKASEFLKSLKSRKKIGESSIGKILAIIFAIAVLTSWIAHQFFDKEVPEFIFEQLVKAIQITILS